MASIMSTESSSSSSSTTSSSCPTPAPDATAGSSQPGGAGSSSATGAEKRFEFLLQQTELFSHFMGDGKKGKAKSPLKIKPGKGKADQPR